VNDGDLHLAGVTLMVWSLTVIIRIVELTVRSLRRGAALLGVLAAGGIVASCDSSLTKPSLYNQVVVATVRRNGQPIPGVGLELYTGPRPMGYATSGANGPYTFERVPDGSYGVIITELPNGFDFPEHIFGGPPTNFVDRLPVAGDTTIQVRFVLVKPGPGTITIHIADASGPSLIGVPVKLYTGDRTIGETITDDSGNATFTDVPFGQYGVVVTRPIFYRDYNSPGDSLYSYRDQLIAEADLVDSTTFSLEACAGTVRVLVLDEGGAPVRNATVTVYTPTERASIGATDGDGRALLRGPCVTSMGVYVTPPAGYAVAAGRGASFFDGVTVTRGGTADVTFRLRPQR
jgi:hypothetical protein